MNMMRREEEDNQRPKIKFYRWKIKISKIKNILDETNSRLDTKKISKLEDITTETNENEAWEKNVKKGVIIR